MNFLINFLLVFSFSAYAQRTVELDTQINKQDHPSDIAIATLKALRQLKTSGIITINGIKKEDKVKDSEPEKTK